MDHLLHLFSCDHACKCIIIRCMNPLLHIFSCDHASVSSSVTWIIYYTYSHVIMQVYCRSKTNFKMYCFIMFLQVMEENLHQLLDIYRDIIYNCWTHNEMHLYKFCWTKSHLYVLLSVKTFYAFTAFIPMIKLAGYENSLTDWHVDFLVNYIKASKDCILILMQLPISCWYYYFLVL